MSDLVLSPRFATFVRDAIADGDVKPYPVPGYRAQVAAWLTYCQVQGLDPETATAADVRTYRRALSRDSTQRYAIPHKLLVLRWFYQSLVTAGIRRDNPAASILATDSC